MPSDKESKEVRDPAALELFKSLGLDSKTAQNAVANPKVTANLTDVVREVGDLHRSIVSTFSSRSTVCFHVCSLKLLLSYRSWIFFFFFLVKPLWGRGVSLTLFPRGAAGALLQAGVAQGCDKSIGNLLYTVCSCSFFSAGFV
jgi:hypothetical protein